MREGLVHNSRYDGMIELLYDDEAFLFFTERLIDGVEFMPIIILL